MKLWIRADASRPTGLGHVMRMIAVEEEASLRGWQTAFVTFDPEQISGPMLKKHGVKPIKLSTSDDRTWSACVGADDLVVFDGYHFGNEDYDAARKRASRVAAMDDFASGEFDVDLLILPGPAPRLDYETPGTTRILAGPEYAPVRQIFVEKRRLRDGSPDTLLLTAGGTDATGVTNRLLDAVPQETFSEVVVMVGPGSYGEAISGRSDVTVVRDPPSVADVFDTADVAVSAAGTTTWELLCMGIPTILVPVSDNQVLIARWADSAGAAISLTSSDEITSELPLALSHLDDDRSRAEMSRRALELVDGRGAERILDALVPNLGQS